MAMRTKLKVCSADFERTCDGTDIKKWRNVTEENMIKVSVIVPVYNVEEYLPRCLDSLIHQTMKEEELEVIVVDDGATDHSSEIIEEYAKKSPRIRAVHKENGGLSDARNYGLPFARGEYVGYVDSDDFIDLDMYELLYRKAKEEDSDMVECNLRHTYSDYEDIEIGQKIYDKKEMIMVGRSVVWNKIYKRDWLLSTGVTFPKGHIYEDVEFFVKLVPYIRKYSYIDEASIHYVQRESSINNLSSKKTLDILNILEHIETFYQERGFYEEYKDALEFLFTRILLCSSFARMSRIRDKQERQAALKKNWNMLIEHYPNWKKNAYLKKMPGKNAIFMRSVNGITYRIYAALLPSLLAIKDRRKGQKVK